MALPNSLEVELEVKASADHFYDTLKGKKQHRVHDVASDHIHKVEVHEGEWEKSGTVKQVTFAVGDTVETLKERVEFDDENKKITYFILEGDMLKYYKSYNVILLVIPKGEHCLVKWSLFYEKVDDTAPAPTKYKDLLVKLTRNIETHLVEEY
ncbi:MLP-like protein 328 [Gastrolobium bilobum]|uniref:MLP-like protein 328 n=1 Tax=Gastrolobium bilobum TaxID=150636 RepID=UPI002AB05951|nr:MLP-like protein 328 [Gastrolobium bilobum]